MASALTPNGSTARWRRLRAAYAASLPAPCGYCHEPVIPGSEWVLGHVVPRSAGGGDDKLRVEHRSCSQAGGPEPPRLVAAVRERERTRPQADPGGRPGVTIGGRVVRDYPDAGPSTGRTWPGPSREW